LTLTPLVDVDVDGDGDGDVVDRREMPHTRGEPLRRRPRRASPIADEHTRLTTTRRPRVDHVAVAVAVNDHVNDGVNDHVNVDDHDEGS